MEWLPLVSSLVGVVVGGLCVIFADMRREHSNRKYDRSRVVSKAYSEFIVSLRRALKSNSDYYAIVRLQEDGQGPSNVSDQRREEIQNSIHEMRVAGWRLLFHEQDDTQVKRIQEMIAAFNVENAHWLQEFDDAADFETKEKNIDAVLKALIADAKRIYSDIF